MSCYTKIMEKLDHIEGLNKAQARAVTHGAGPALVVAGAGTGKTTVITRRIAWLIATGKARPDEILALTFTDKAAREMEERVDHLLPYGVVSTNIMTFHALGDQILRDQALEIGISTDFQVMSGFQQIIFMQQILPELELDHYAPLGNPYQFLGALATHFSRLKDECITPAMYREFADGQSVSAETEEDKSEAERVRELAFAYSVYTEQARAQAKLDFGDQISLTIELFKERPRVLLGYQKRFKYIMVDEYQDTNYAQNEFVKMLSKKHRNIMVVGDDDQSIYRFRGASIANILQFKKQYPKTKQIVMTENYRSTQEILDISHTLVAHNNPDRLEVQNKIDKRLVGFSHGPVPVLIQTPTLPEEMQMVARQVAKLISDGIQPRDIAILMRKNSQSSAIMLALEAEGIMAETSQRESLFMRAEVKALLNFVAVMNDPKDSSAMYGLLAGDIYQMQLSSLVSMTSQAKREHSSLEQHLRGLEGSEAGVERVIEHIDEYREYARELSAGQLLYKFIHEQGYLGKLLEVAESSNEAALKIQNIAQFFGLIREFENISLDPTIYHFWAYVSEMRSSDADILATESPLDQNCVRIMTIHKAKGLEFEAVFVPNMVADVFPSRRQAEKIQIPDGLIDVDTSREWHVAEERRLCYVALTRAKKHLYLSCSYDHGGARLRKMSPFVAEALGAQAPIQLEAKTGALELIDQFAVPQKPEHDLTAHLYEDGWLNLTPHQIDDYLRDPEKFWLFHVLKLPQGPFHALVYGSAIHHAIEFYYRGRLNGRTVPLKDVQQAFVDAWSSEGFVSKRHEEQRLSRGREVIKRFYEREKESVLPQSVELPFSLVLPELKVRISGRYDAVFSQAGDGAKNNQRIEIRDFKTSQAKDQAAAERKLKDNIQLAIYALAWERTAQTPVASVSLDFVEAGLIAATTKIDHVKTLEKIKRVADGIARRDFKGGAQSLYKVTQPW